MKRLPLSRDRINNVHMSIADVIYALADNNPGALDVCLQLSKVEDIALILLDANNIYGADIWIAYKDYANSDINTLIHALKDPVERQVMITVILAHQ